MNLPTDAISMKNVRLNRFLPYYAVLQGDLQQTFQSWLYRLWVFLSFVVAIGYLLYRFGAYKEAGLLLGASELSTDIIRWVILGSLTLIIVFTSGCITSERGTLADSILSRGISRNQYYIGKLHSRLLSVLGTFFLLGLIVIAATYFLLRDDRLTITGGAVALVHVALIVIVVVSVAVAVSACCNSTLLAVSLVWIILYALGFCLSILPPVVPSPDRALQNLPNVLRGYHDFRSTSNLAIWSVGVSSLASFAGMWHFSRKDI